LLSILDENGKISGPYIDFHGEILQTFDALVTEIATLYFEVGPPEHNYQDAEQCFQAWIKAQNGPSSWALGTTCE
jgi:hypothetical protein